MTRLVGYAYPWDVVGDPQFVPRVRALGLTEVALAASYHSARAATPMHPDHLVVEAPEAALYRPVRSSAWAGRPLVPAPADWVAAEDAFGLAATRLSAAGIAVSAWIVLTHSTRLGRAHPEFAVRNCVGDSYPYALCPAHPEVQEYAATLTAEALRGVAVAGVSLESCGQLGVGHNGRHEKTAGAFPPAAQRLISVCCCAACAAGWAVRGQDPVEVTASLAAATRAVLAGRAAPDADVAELIGDERAAAILAARAGAATALRAGVLAAARSRAPGARLTLHGRVETWATTPDVAVGPDTVTDLDAVLVSAWPTSPASLAAVADTRAVLPEPVAVGAYLTVLPPAAPDEVVHHAGALLGAGATELHLYHLGLAPPSGQRLLAEIIARCRDAEPEAVDFAG